MRLFSIIKNTIFDPEFKKIAISNSLSFTRKRQLSFEYLILFFLLGAFKSLSVAIPEFISLLGAHNLTFTKQALSKARKNITYKAFIFLNDILVKEFYKQKQKTFKGYRLLAVDGTKIELPNTKKILSFFGTDKRINKHTPRARAVSFFDVVNGLIFNVKVYKYSISERDCLIEQAKEIKNNQGSQKDIIIADRGFPSISVFIELRQMGYDFVMRYNGENFIKEFADFPKSKLKDLTRKVNPREVYKRKYKNALKKSIKTYTEEEIELRVVKIKLKKGKTEYLITSLTDEKKITKGDLKHIYNSRWGIEENFKYQKEIVQIENFSGKTIEAILQDYYSKIVTMNLHLSMSLKVNKRIEKTVKKKKNGTNILTDKEKEGNKSISNAICENKPNGLKYYKYKVNKAISYGLFRLYLFKIILSEGKEAEKLYNNLLESMNNHKIPEIKNRNNTRFIKDKLKFPSNKRKVA